MNAKVDVLAWLDAVVEREKELDRASGIFSGRAEAAAFVRHAVAEVLKSGNALCDLMPGLAGGPEFDRFVAALANAGEMK